MPDKNSIVLRNTMRRPLTFHVGGTTVRLAPGQRVELPAKWLASADLQRFTGAGLIVNESSVRQQVARVEERAEEREKEPAEELVEHGADERAERREEEPTAAEAEARSADEGDEGEPPEATSLFHKLTGKKSAPKSSKTGKHKPSKPEK